MTNEEKLEIQMELGDWLHAKGLSVGAGGDLRDEGGLEVVMSWDQVERAVKLLREAEGKVLVDRRALEMSLTYATQEVIVPSKGMVRYRSLGTRLCRWVGPNCDICQYEARVPENGARELEVIEPHSGTCPLKEEA